MKLKMNFKQTGATSAGDINLPNLLVFIDIPMLHTFCIFSELPRQVSVIGALAGSCQVTV